MNSAYYSGASIPASSPGVNGALSAIVTPASTVFVTEAIYGQGYKTSGYTSAVVTWPTGTITYSPTASPFPALMYGTYQIAAVNHSGGTNVLWCDGHAKWMTGDGLTATHTVNGQQVDYLWTNQDD